MSKLKIEHGVSRVRRAKLQVSVDQSIADDIQALADWSNNEPQYVVNHLLRFALMQEEDFQKYKGDFSRAASKISGEAKSASTSAKAAPDANLKTGLSSSTSA